MCEEVKICNRASCKLAGTPQPIDNFSRLKRKPKERFNACMVCIADGKANGEALREKDKNYACDRMAGYYDPISSDHSRMLMFMVSKSLYAGTGAR